MNYFPALTIAELLGPDDGPHLKVKKASAGSDTLWCKCAECEQRRGNSGANTV